MMPFRNRFEQGGAQGGGQRQGEESREGNRYRHSGGKLGVNLTARACKEQQRHKHGNQHGGNTDNRTGNLRHGFFRRLFRRQPFLGHNPFHVFHHHNRIVHDDTDHQHHGEHGQHVNRHTEILQAGKRAQQRNRYDNGRNQGIADILQEEEHHDKHQQNCLGQRLHHFFNRDGNEFRSIVRCIPLHVAGEEFLQFVHPFAHGGGGSHRVTLVGQHDGHTDGRLAVQSGGSGIFLAAQLDTRHVFQVNVGAVGVCTDDDVAEFFGCFQLAFRRDGGGNGLSAHIRQGTERTGGNLGVLRRDGRRNLGHGEVVVLQLFRIHPNPHRTLRTEQAGFADTVDTLNFGLDITLHIVGNFLRTDGVGRHHQNHQEVGARFGDGYAVLLHSSGQCRGYFRQFVLHLDLGKTLISFRRKGQADRTAAAGCGVGGHVVQTFHAVHVPFDDGQYAVFHHLCRRAGIGGSQRDGGRAHRRILRHRQRTDADYARQYDKYRDYPRENGAVDKKLSHIRCSLFGFGFGSGFGFGFDL